VQHEALFEMLESLDLNGKDIMLIKNFYWDQQAAVRINGICGNHEGCETGVYSVTRFVLFYTEMIIRCMKELDGIRVGGVNLNNLRYADDTAQIADSEQKLQQFLGCFG